MKPTTTFRIPWPPSVNNIYVRTGRGTALSKRVLAYRSNVALACYEQRAYRWKDMRLEIRIVAHPPDRKTRDLDNLLKAALDALQECQILDDDANIDKIVIERGPVDTRPAKRRNGRLDVSIRPRKTKADRTADDTRGT